MCVSVGVVLSERFVCLGMCVFLHYHRFGAFGGGLRSALTGACLCRSVGVGSSGRLSGEAAGAI